ncbi:MAG: hypothetical protein CL561_09345 [Alphaproteobacteria bacterium]|nr:hypothetical protein [Alphaproteobacteria bacterium]|tara:strand:- start:541 stop:1554 length:1014 start_codon:yes stop_codon:yes gene_type:complete
MNMNDKMNGIYFVYDGECPLCRSAAYALRIKEKFGALHLINARTEADHPLMAEINKRGLDLDEGMIIYDGSNFYHGQTALEFMARHGAAKNSFTVFCKSLFRWRPITVITYPWMRGTRNMLIRNKNIGRIDNLNHKSTPIFQSIFSDAWDNLPPVLKKHYANRPYCNDIVTVSGHLDIMCKAPLTWLAPIMRLMGQIPPANEENVPVTVEFKSDLHSKAFQFNRQFYFKSTKPYAFRSQMIQVQDNVVIEVMRFGLGWKMRYTWDGTKVILSHKGYALKLFGHFVPVPLTLFMGKGYAEEVAVDEHRFDMITHITHPWWGKVYQYKGRFEIMEKLDG